MFELLILIMVLTQGLGSCSWNRRSLASW